MSVTDVFSRRSVSSLQRALAGRVPLRWPRRMIAQAVVSMIALVALSINVKLISWLSAHLEGHS